GADPRGVLRRGALRLGGRAARRGAGGHRNAPHADTAGRERVRDERAQELVILALERDLQLDEARLRLVAAERLVLEEAHERVLVENGVDAGDPRRVG